MYTFSFEKLDVWQLSRKLVKEIYLLSKDFPEEEKFGLISQIRRAAVSVSSNIAEGNSRFSDKDKARFIEMAYCSVMEVFNQLILAKDLEYIGEEDLLKKREFITEIANKLNSFHKKILNRIPQNGLNKES